MLANIIRNTKKTAIGGGGGGIVTGGDPYYSAVSLLLSMDGTNGSTTFTDSSLNALTVTAVGNAQISTTQSKYGGASGYFDGAGDYLSIAANAAINLSSSDFTIEFWIRPAPKTNAVDAAFGYSNYACMFYHNGTNWTLELSSTGFSNQLVISCAVTLNDWQHIAIVRSGSSIVVYKDGISSATGTFSGTVATSGRNLRIGDNGNSQNINGYIDDFRITKYARYQSSFTPPAQAHPNIYNPYTTLPVSGAALWLAGDDSSTLFTDAGTSAVTKSGDLVYQWTDKSGNSRNAIQTTSGNRPTWVAPANARNNLGALAFNGTSQFLNLASDPIGTNDYTIEFWMKQEATTASYWVILDSRVSGNAIGYPVILYNNSSTALSFYNNGWLLSATVSVSTWTHVAITRSSGTIRMFVNGSIASSGTDTSSYNTFRQLGKAFDPYYFKGQIQNLIIYNGQALYTANFTPWMS